MHVPAAVTSEKAGLKEAGFYRWRAGCVAAFSWGQAHLHNGNTEKMSVPIHVLER